MADNLLLIADDDAEESGGDEWLMTFADMSTLLLTFFILLMSMSHLDKARFADNFSSVREQFGGDKMRVAETGAAVGGTSPEALMDSVRERERIIAAQKQSLSEIQTFLTRTAHSDIVKARVDNDKITLTVPSEVLFAPGSEVVLPAAAPFLAELRNLFLKERQQNINIKGYTDNSPLPTGARFKDNWELSALRAVNILRTMLDGGIEAVRLTATGLGDLNPVAPNTTDENRALNRRVEFELERRAGAQ